MTLIPPPPGRWGQSNETPEPGALERRLWGRSNRLRYWLATALYVLVLFGAQVAHLPSLVVQLGFPLVWVIFIAWPRLHDFGWSGGWGFSPLLFGFVLGCIKLFVTGMTHPEPETLAMIQGLYGWTLGLASIAFRVWIGVRKGDPDSNRFGPPPGVRTPANAAEAFD